jgi:cytolysin (calcineurin-like family phosphatase)
MPHAGVVITGDLINDGINPALCHQQWHQFQQTYGLAEGHGFLQFPVYEGVAR